MTGNGSPIQGVTLYSFTRAFHGREYDLEGLIRKTAAEGFGPGVNGPLTVIAELPPGTDPAVAGPIAEALAATPGVAFSSPAVPNDPAAPTASPGRPAWTRPSYARCTTPSGKRSRIPRSSASWTASISRRCT